MTRKEFLDNLYIYLDKLPRDERLDVIEYYKEIFDDIGCLNNEDIVPDKYNPKKIAYDILIDIKSKDLENDEIKGKSIGKYIGIIILSIAAAPIALPFAIILGILFLIPIVIFASLIFGFGFSSVLSFLLIFKSIYFGLGSLIFILGVLFVSVSITLFTFFLMILYLKLIKLIIDKIRYRNR